MNSSEFNLQDHSQMISPNSRLDDNHNRDDVRVDENPHDGDMRATITGGTDIGTMHTKVEGAPSSCSGDRIEKHHAPMKRDPDEKFGLNLKSSSPPPSREKKATLRSTTMDDGESHDVNTIDDPATTITGAGISEISPPSYYTDNIAAACAATNDELASGVPTTGGPSKGEGENDSENRKRQKRARHKRQPSAAEDKVTKRSFETDVVQQNTAESSAVSLVIAELQRENLALVQENAALKQNFQHLSYLLERSLAGPSRGDFNTLLAQSALLQQPQALSPPLSLQSHLSQLLNTTTQASLGANSSALQHASDAQVASFFGIGGNESSQEQRVQAEQQRLRVASILSALGSSNPPSNNSNPLVLSSVLAGADVPSRTVSQSSSLLEQLLLASSPAAVSTKGATPSAAALLGGDVSTTPTFSELQRYLLEGRGSNTSLGGSLNHSHNTSLKGAVATEPVGGPNVVTTFSSTSQQAATTTTNSSAAVPPRRGLPDNRVATNRAGTGLTPSQNKRNKHKGAKQHP